jgi:ubiquinone/menaquinone biosynthesis C-methylase UbiE
MNRADRPIRHPVFAAFYDRMMAGVEAQLLPEHREALSAGIEGAVLDLGAGTGAMFPYLDASGADAVYAIEPDPHMLTRASDKAREEEGSVRLCRASAERLPFADGSLDAVISSLILCTVRDVPVALGEVSRVLRPGGEFRFFEHVRSEGAFGKAQDLGAPLWKRVAAGCHLNRRTERSIRDSSLEVVSVITFEMSGIPVRTFIRGVAVRPA